MKQPREDAEAALDREHEAIKRLKARYGTGAGARTVRHSPPRAAACTASALTTLPAARTREARCGSMPRHPRRPRPRGWA